MKLRGTEAAQSLAREFSAATEGYCIEVAVIFSSNPNQLATTPEIAAPIKFSG